MAHFDDLDANTLTIRGDRSGDDVIVTGKSGLMTASSPVLDSVSFNPASSVTAANAATALADVDAANLAVTFTTPASGEVAVLLEGVANVSVNGANFAVWGLREGSTEVSARACTTNGLVIIRCSATLFVSGLVPGSVHTYKWGHGVSAVAGGSAGQVSYGISGNFGPAVMIVLAV